MCARYLFGLTGNKILKFQMDNSSHYAILTLVHVCAVLLVVTIIRYTSISLLHFEIEFILQYHLQFDATNRLLLLFVGLWTCVRDCWHSRQSWSQSKSYSQGRHRTLTAKKNIKFKLNSLFILRTIRYL